MQHYLRQQIDWPQPFTSAEYAARRALVRAAMVAKGIDALYVTVPANLTYLTGYDMIWYHARNMTGLLLRVEDDTRLWFDDPAHTTLVSTTPEIPEAVWFDTGSADPLHVQIAREIAARGLGRGRIALEPWGYSPHGEIMRAFAETLRACGAEVIDATYLIEEIRLVKSPAEIAVMREAAAMADRAMAAARDALKPGMKETEIEAEIAYSLMKDGGGYPAIRTMVGSGPRAGTHHSAASHRRLRQGDLVFIDFCASLHRYHVNLNRTFSLGDPDPRWVKLMETSAAILADIFAAVKPGDAWSAIPAAGERYLAAHGIDKYVWWTGGYALGIAIPPDWTGVHFAQPFWGREDRPVVPGMIFNYENQFDVWENWPGGSGAAWIETIITTETGFETLSALPRTLVAV